MSFIPGRQRLRQSPPARLGWWEWPALNSVLGTPSQSVPNQTSKLRGLGSHMVFKTHPKTCNPDQRAGATVGLEEAVCVTRLSTLRSSHAPSSAPRMDGPPLPRGPLCQLSGRSAGSTRRRFELSQSSGRSGPVDSWNDLHLTSPFQQRSWKVWSCYGFT